MLAPARKPFVVGRVVSASFHYQNVLTEPPQLLDSDTRTALRADIAVHLLENGSSNWGELRKRYPQVAEATFWRYVARTKAAKRTTATDNSLNPPENPAEPNLVAATDFPLPSNLAPLRASEMRDELRSQFADADSLREYAVDQHGNIRRPQAFVASIDIRAKILATAVRVNRAIDTIEHRQRFEDAIVGIVIEHVPKSEQLVVIEKLEGLFAAQPCPTEFR